VQYWRPMTPWVSGLLVANLAVFFLERAMPGLAQRLALVPARLPDQPWTIVTYMFVHAGFGHIFGNMLSLYVFGPRLEDKLGSTRFAWLYFASGIAGGLLSWVFDPYTPIVGASGAVFGVSLGFAYYWPRETIYIWGVLPLQAWVLVAILTVLNLFGFEAGVAHFAHLGGFAGGFLMILLFERTSRARRFHARTQPVRSRADVEKWSRIRREALHEVNRDEYDRIMTKLKEQGLGSLTPDERTTLDNFSNRAV
jgi:rhomboid family protein